MSKYDSGFRYDAKPISGGFIYDTSLLIHIVNVFETIKFQDLAMDLAGELHLIETLDFIEEAFASVNININDNISFKDSIEVSGLVQLLDELKLIDKIKEVSTIINLVDEIIFNESDIKTATTDYYIGRSERDSRYDTWLEPFGLLLTNTSKMPIMPEPESTMIDIAGQDGSIITDTRYKSRFWELIGRTKDGLTKEQKERIKVEILSLLGDTKEALKKLTIQQSGLTLEVKYAGGVEGLFEGNSLLEIPMNFDVSPYGTKQFAEIFEGSGYINNDGKTSVGAKVIISSGCLNPNFRIGDVEFLWQGQVPSGQSLIVDNENKSIYLIDESGNTTQASTQMLIGREFKTVPVNTTMQVSALNSSTESHMTTEYTPKYFWLDYNGKP